MAESAGTAAWGFSRTAGFRGRGDSEASLCGTVGGMPFLFTSRPLRGRPAQTLAAILAGLLLPACIPSIERCEGRSPLPHPEASDAFERRQPKEPPPIAVKGLPEISVTPKPFEEDRWGERVFDALPPRQAPEIRDTGPVHGGTPLVCSFEVRAQEGVDGLNDINGRTWISISTPDLILWADIAGTKLNKGPRFASTSATFTFRAGLRTNERVVFEFGDYDFFSSNEYIGRIDGSYPGSVPFQIRGPVGTAVCRATSSELLAAEAKIAGKQLDSAIAEYEAWTPTLEEPLGTSKMEPITRALGTVEYFTEENGEARTNTIRRLNDAASRQWKTYVGLVAKTFNSLPPAGSWVPVTDFAEARVAGLSCRLGDRYRRSDCAVELLVRLQKEPGGAFCPLDSGRLGDFGPLSFLRSDGRVLDSGVDGVRTEEGWLQDAMALTRLLPGAVIAIRLTVDGASPHDSESGWDIPLLRIDKTYLRIHGG